jgi:protocatechuate 3,4-dioxygenase beta subunit
VKKLAPYSEFISRRRALALFGASATLLGCGGGSGGSSTSTSATSTGTSVSCVLTPEETAGPYPLFNDIASASTYMREDITEGKTGIPLQLLLTFVNVNANCTPITDALVYTWHCDKDGAYSGYNQPGNNTVGQTFCRGVQMTDGTGLARFTTIYPGWYSGRITHVHFRVYLGNALEATSQLCFPQDITRAVYNTSPYVARGQNTSVTSFSQDGVFSDGEQYQLCTTSQNATTGGYDAALTVGVAL